ncbi:MAG: prepilin peptidase [Sulfuricella sp.]|nr:prepilin peptidase [Sulfuricella sp.]
MTPKILGWLALLPMLLLLATAVLEDIKHHRIPNSIAFSGAGLGILFNAVLPEGLGFVNPMLPGGLGFLGGLEGAALGLALLLPIYLLRAMGAGDVKLMAMVGAFLGPEDVFGSILATFLTGGVLSLAYAWKIGILRRTLQNIWFILYSSMLRAVVGSPPALDDAPETAGKFPYAVAIATGTLGYLVWKSM